MVLFTSNFREIIEEGEEHPLSNYEIIYLHTLNQTLWNRDILPNRFATLFF